MNETSVTQQGEKGQENSLEAGKFEAELEAMSKMDYPDFRMGVVDKLRKIQDAIFLLIERYAKDRDSRIDVIVKRFESTDKVIEKVIEDSADRIENLEKALFVYFLSKRKTENYEDLKELSSMLNINLEEVIQELKTGQEVIGGEV